MTLRRIASTTAAAVTVTLAATAAIAVPGRLDPSFGGDGTVTTDFTRSFDVAADVAIQNDQKIVVVGSARGGKRFAVARYETDGSLDPTFGGDGKVTTNLTRHQDRATAVTVQTTGEIVVAGQVVRFRRAGVVGRFALVRYEDDGTLDTSFGGGDGIVTTDFTPGWDRAAAVALHPGGGIVVAGAADLSCSCSRFALARYLNDGSLDGGFGGDGRVTTRFPGVGAAADDVAVEPGGEIVAVGGQLPEGARFMVARYEADGSRDPTFGGDGRVRTRMGSGEGSATGVAILPNRKVLVAGFADVPHEFGDPFRPVIALARYLPGGTLDDTFGHGDGRVRVPTRRGMITEDLARQADGRIVVAGFTLLGREGRFAVARFRRFGGRDRTFGGDGTITTNLTRGEDAANAVALEAGGRIVVAGRAAGRGGRFAVARYLGS
jgi:uncharacterized delta-60 repeat protein